MTKEPKNKEREVGSVKEEKVLVFVKRGVGSGMIEVPKRLLKNCYD